MKNYQIEKIDFETIVEFWKEQEHFHPRKKFVEKLGWLGLNICHLKNPITQAYGLYLEGELISATQIQVWDNNTIRWRTINVKEEYRGDNLGWKFLSNVLQDWKEYDVVFGWVRENIYEWAIKNGFTPEGEWIEENGVRNIRMNLQLENVKNEHL